jgi:hypothetical protein
VTGFQIANAAIGSFNVYNGDIANVLLVSSDQSPQLSNSIPVQPLTNATIIGNRPWYASALTGTIASLTVSSAAQLSPSPAQIAAQIELLDGIPPSDNPKLLAVTLGGSVGAGGTFTSSHIPIGQYNSWFGTSFGLATSAGTGTTPYYRVTFNYSMAVDNYDPLEVADWVGPITPYNFTYVYRNDMSSPCWGDTLDVVVTNYDTEPFNWTYSIFGSYRTRIREKLRGRYNNVSVGEQAGLGSDNVLCNFASAGIGPGGSSGPYLVDLWDGEADISVYANYPGLDVIECQLSPQPSSILNPTTAFSFPHGGISGYTYYENVALSRRVNTMTLVNRHPTQTIAARGLIIAKGVNE